MKYFEGWIVLSDYLNKCLFHDEQKTQIKIKLDLILHRLHRLSIAHNDIDTHTILIHSKNYQIRLMDLGFCITRFALNISEDEFKNMKQKDIDMLKTF